jgi:hypothetical protein
MMLTTVVIVIKLFFLITDDEVKCPWQAFPDWSNPSE